MTILRCPGVAVATDPTGVRAGADDTENWIEALASKCGRPMVRMDTVAHTVGTREGEYELGRNRPLDLPIGVVLGADHLVAVAESRIPVSRVTLPQPARRRDLQAAPEP